MMGGALLHTQSEGGHASTVKALLDHGFHINVQTVAGDTPLRLAARKGRLSVVRILVEKDVDLRGEDKVDDMTALILVFPGMASLRASNRSSELNMLPR